MTARASVLIVEDERSERDALARLLRMEQYRVVTARDPEEAMRHVDEPIDLVVSDLRMGKASGIDLLREWRGRRPETPFLLITAYGDVDSAVTSMKLGADDYLTKPVEPVNLLARLEQLLRAAPRPCPPRARARVESGGRLEEMVGDSQAMREVFGRIERAAQTESLVLILGESGTGKELAAAAIHRRGRRSSGPFVAVNIAAIPEGLVESELFGHVQGAFTGSACDRVGKFEAASGGTLFIDEIGDFALAAQAKLLRVLETLRVTPVGSNNEQKVDVRVVAATSRNLSELVTRGEFREDLYYRLNVVTVRLPPLRERREDIPLLVEAFLAESCAANSKPLPRLDPALAGFLQQYAWPGNVRQLRNVIESMVVLARHDVITCDDLPESLGDHPQLSEACLQLPSDATLDDLARAAVLQALRHARGNRTHAAEALGISVRTLQRKLKAWRTDGGDALPAETI